jgi:hypothetical protein
MFSTPPSRGCVTGLYLRPVPYRAVLRQQADCIPETLSQHLICGVEVQALLERPSLSKREAIK